MPIDYKRYPKNWKEIRAAILERAENRCERCGVANYAVGARDVRGRWWNEVDIDTLKSDVGYALFGGDYPKIIRIVLTVAHLDHDIQNNDYGNLATLCQRCHLNHDREDNLGRRRRNRVKRAGQGQLFADDVVFGSRPDGT